MSYVSDCCFSLVDIDECKLNTDECDINASCNNTEGSYLCTCNSGYQGTGLICTGKRVIQVVHNHYKTGTVKSCNIQQSFLIEKKISIAFIMGIMVVYNC